MLGTPPKPTCPLRKNPERCIQRQNWTPQPKDCRVCDFYGRKAPEETKPSEVVTIRPRPDTKPVSRETIPPVPVTKPASNETIPREEEEGKMDAATAKTGILRVLERKGTMSASNVRLFAARSMGPKEFRAVLDDLIREGKVVGTPGQREGSLTVRLQGTPPPPERKAEKKASAPAKPLRSAREIAVDERKKKMRPATAGSPPPKNGGGRTSPSGDAIAAALTELRRRRELIDKAIHHLEEASA